MKINIFKASKGLTLQYSSFIAFQFFLSSNLYAQVALESQIMNTINGLVRIVNILIFGFIVWAGFTIARGDESGMKKLMYGIIGLVVVNAAQLIVNYFR